MERKEEKRNAQTLHDKPVPPVKGAVVDQEDVLLWPKAGLGKNTTANLEDTIIFDGWL